RLQRGRVRTYRGYSGRVIAVIAGIIGLPPNRRSSKVLQVRSLKYLEKYLFP
ncbi:hypothetical protein L249_5436, partial [Ophiocordyceps polyrhachis-furcata BCC 54312]